MALAGSSALAVDGRAASLAEDESVESDGAIEHAVQRTSIQENTNDFIDPHCNLSARGRKALDGLRETQRR
jgi:hypothetical protein